MNSKTNCTFFIIIALLASVKNSYTNSNQLVTKSPYARSTIKEAKTFESPNPFAVLSALDNESELGHMNNEPADSGLLSDESGGPRPSQEQESLNIPAEETRLTKNNGSRWGMPSVEGIVSKGLPYFVTALGLLNGAQGASSDCSEDVMHLNCNVEGWGDCFDPNGRSAGFRHSILVSSACAGGFALAMVGHCLFYRHQLKKIRSRNTERGILMHSVQTK